MRESSAFCFWRTARDATSSVSTPATAGASSCPPCHSPAVCFLPLASHTASSRYRYTALSAQCSVLSAALFGSLRTAAVPFRGSLALCQRAAAAGLSSHFALGCASSSGSLFGSGQSDFHTKFLVCCRVLPLQNELKVKCYSVIDCDSNRFDLGACLWFSSEVFFGAPSSLCRYRAVGPT